MKRWLTFAGALIAFTAAAEAATLKSFTITVPVASPALACPLRSVVDGAPTSSYQLAAGSMFAFADPLPSHAVLWSIDVQAALLAPCAGSVPIAVHVNPAMPGVVVDDSSAGLIVARNIFTSCTSGGTFSMSFPTSKSMISPKTIPYLRGGANEIHLRQGVGPGCSDVLVELVQITFNYYDDLPVITFDVTDSSPPTERRVILHRYRSDAESDYTSSRQRALPGTDVSKDSRIQFSGTIADRDGTPLANQPVYLRVVDPPDPSPYVPVAESHRGDNPGGAVSLFQLPFDTRFLWQQVMSDDDGRFSLPLQVHPWWAGYNAAVEASPLLLPLPYDDMDRCNPQVGCYRSAEFTSWRRLYIEADAMFRAGGFIRLNAPSGATEIAVDRETLQFFQGARENRPISAVIMQAPPLSVSNPRGQFKSETVNVIGLRRGRNPALLIATPLLHEYTTEPSREAPALPAGAAIGRYGGPADLLPRRLDSTLAVLSEVYVEGKVLADGSANAVPFLPYIETCDGLELYCIEIAHRWFEHRTSTRASSNHLHVVTATSFLPASVGNTYLDQHPSYAPFCAVWHDRIVQGIAREPQYQGQQLDPVLQEVTAHEVVHSFDVNQPALTGPDPSEGHCPEGTPSWQGGFCLMSPSRTAAERGDGRVPLHVDPWITSEYRRMRNRPDPLPQYFQPAFQPND